MIFILKNSTEIKNIKLNIHGDYKMFYIHIFYIDFFFYYYILKKLFQPIYISIGKYIYLDERCNTKCVLSWEGNSSYS